MKTRAELQKLVDSEAGFEQAMAAVDAATTEAAIKHRTAVSVSCDKLGISSYEGIQRFCELLRRGYDLIVKYENDQRDGDYIRISW